MRFLSAVLLISAMGSTALADRTNSCYDPDHNLWGNGAVNQTINVYVNNNTAQGLQYAFNADLANTELVVIRALNILNEEMGGTIKLAYAGTTTSTGYISGGIVLRYAYCSNSGNLTNAAAVAYRSPGSGTPTAGIVEFYKYYGTNCTLWDWSFAEDTGTDIVPVILHELGHAVFNMNHVNDNPAAPNCEDIGQATVMRPYTNTYGIRGRVLKAWDIEVFQQRYKHHGLYAKFWKRFRSGPTTWSTAGAAPLQSLNPLFRPGSLPQRSTTRLLGWQQNSQSYSNFAGAGRTDSARYAAGWQAWQTHQGAGYTLPRPVAVAQRVSSSEVLIAYQKVSSSAGYGDGNDIGNVCYRVSYNSGTTWGTEQCYADANREAYRYGLTAAYDPVSASFLIAYISSGHRIGVWTVPASGSTTPMYVRIITDRTSWHAPSIACASSGTANCRLVYEADTNAGLVTWNSAYVETGGSFPGRFSTSGSAVTTGLYSYDTPSVVYNPSGNEFVMAVSSKSNAAFGYTMPTSGSSWTGVGDIWNDSTSFISTVVLGVRLNPGVNPTGDYTQAWWLKFR